jgi:uncharacterized membrane protein
MLQSSEIRAEARRLLSGQWNNCAIIMLVFGILQAGLSAIPVLGYFSFLIVTGPLALGLAAIYTNLVRGGSFGIETLFKAKDDFMRSFIAGLLVLLFTLLWSILLIIPGIIASLSYSMTFFILNDNPRVSASDAIKLSQEMMMGHKMELFMLMLSFIGWFILGVIGWGIPFLWIGAYYYASFALFYQSISGAANEEVTGFIREEREFN